MGNYRVCVYAICKNEEKFAKRWYDSMSEADEIVVLDTGSDDNTVRILKELGAKVTQEVITPWRFDAARNRSLDLVGEDIDICVCTDLDEVFHAGWREKVEAAWRDDVRRLRYRYTWNFKEDGSEGVVFWSDKIHARHGFCWVNPVHEVLEYNGGAYQTGTAEGVQLDHRADNTKSRAQYLPLLELAVQENPENDRNMHYLGREYFFHSRWKDCIVTLRRHLDLPCALWADERCASMRYLARAYWQLKDDRQAMVWLLRACAEAPHLREPWLDAARIFYEKGDWHAVAAFCAKALEIQERPRTYIIEAESFGALPHDLLSVACYQLGLLKDALHHAKLAHALAPEDARIMRNIEIMMREME